MKTEFLDCFRRSVAAAPPGLPAPKLHLFQETPVGKIVGIQWDEKEQVWFYASGDGFCVSSEAFYLEALEKGK